MHILSSKIWFPPIEEALEDGLLAIGGDLSTERLILAYQKGIFPWFDGETPLWWSPDPRFVLFPEQLVISKSMHQIIKKNLFEYKTNTSFSEVIKQCKHQPRIGQDGTWITEAVEFAYNELHQKGIALSAEAWHNNELVGGLYGIKMGRLFFGESMFSKVSNASKFAFIKLVNQLKLEGIVLIDCQVYTPHLESLGAIMISRTDFKKYLEEYG
ncbi:leucyl/phenylalanyl-tRNA--protein transferase [Sediminibacterium sp.]|uniref:leucyl/phenylalanyl-tRNA--protein transferase n=1 Tax=Sediminibacterium sp. TaxID=1917865 RepID=UPI000BC86B0D|nr:leucyl/phenylalanyl-tRNA--protein transferase [Sediminibacterium sp.]MDP3394090.1 leucyl/phenylalanyl-tRNA--protein transferase [Sediminibacterium sp.]MDP3566321.1 leucyl/phenylalanyl-tRNA--protein transferase [Sediminibacterium sp.]OYZ02634.1 MAG: leucyl/phenylalanyl-tRNA--protein transferase [Sphingobacteriia bacterium 28-36-52]